MRRSVSIALLSVSSLLVAPLTSADTIVLKNGRHIVAQSVTDEGDRVSYETPAGRLSLPKSIVARIDRNDFGANSFRGSSDPPVTPPQVDPAQGYDDAARGAIHDGSVDVAYLAKLENEAHNGGSTAVAKVAAAHHAAAQFLLAKGDVEAAADHYRRALTFAPTNVGLLLNLAVLRLRQSQYSEAMDPLERAERVAPDSPDVPKLMGWAYYGQNKLDQAVDQWKRSVHLRPDAEVQHALEKAERDRQEEESYRQGETAHFALKYFGGATPDLARGVLRALEEDYRDIESQLDYTPRDQIGVILYTEQSFVDITRAPGWAGAINDGRIRLPVQGLTTVTGELNRVLRHELTHSFVTQKTRGRCPTWLQEGIAQWMEGRRSGESAPALVAAHDAKDLPSIANLEGSWMNFSGDAAGLAYAWSLAATESIIQAGGVGDVSRLLDHIAASPSTEEALRETFRIDYADLDQQTLVFLHKEYLR